MRGHLKEGAANLPDHAGQLRRGTGERRHIVYLAKSPAALLRICAAFRPAKGATFAGLRLRARL
jgi:hypothetical protein